MDPHMWCRCPACDHEVEAPREEVVGRWEAHAAHVCETCEDVVTACIARLPRTFRERALVMEAREEMDGRIGWEDWRGRLAPVAPTCPHCKGQRLRRWEAHRPCPRAGCRAVMRDVNVEQRAPRVVDRVPAPA